MHCKFAAVFSAAILAGSITGAFGQAVNGKKQGEPLTNMKDGPRSGSQNMGSTGWTGGAGTSDMGVNQEGPPESGQPKVAKGLDPFKDKDSQGTPASPH